MAIISPQIEHSVVAIGIYANGPEPFWIGTGFFFGVPSKTSGSYLLLISNRHVLSDKKDIVLRLTSKDGTIKNCDLHIEGEVVYHPIQSIDVAGVLLRGGWFDDNFKDITFLSYPQNVFTSAQYLREGGYNGSACFMIGFTLGHIARFSTAPICRKGCIARMNDVEKSDHKEFLLDIQNFPGNSGSPVFSCPELVSLKGQKVIASVKLIGIVSAYLPYTDELRSSQSNCIVEIRQENSGIAVAHPAECILDVVKIILSNAELIDDVVIADPV